MLGACEAKDCLNLQATDATHAFFRLMHLPLTNRQALKSASHHSVAIESIILATQLWYNSKSIVRLRELSGL